MSLTDLLFDVRQGVRSLRGKPTNPWFDYKKAQLDTSEGPKELAKTTSDIAQLFYNHEGRVIHKWTHYLDIYERHFAPYRDKNPKFLEIGVQMGGSLEMWRKYFGPDATIYGVDIDPACADRATAPTQVRIGSQDDPAFLKKVIAEMGAPDIILDDGSHIAPHQWESFRTLFPLLKDGGLYVIEDLHTAYAPGVFKGGYRRAGSAIELVKHMIDDMHAWYHGHRQVTPGKTDILGIHMYDSVVFIEKGRKSPPEHIKVAG